MGSPCVKEDHMEKRVAKTSGSRPTPRNGSVHRHGHMSSSVPAAPRNNFNLEHQDDHHKKRFRRPPSFCGRSSETQKSWEAASPKLKKNETMTMRRPKTHPELLIGDQWRNTGFMNNTVLDQAALTASKLLVNVTVAQSIGPLRALLSKDATVEDVIKATLVLYAKEGRKPLLSNDPTSFGLHYSQFSIDCLNPADKVKDLGSRIFFLCSKATARQSFQSGETDVTAPSSLSSSCCGKEIQNISGIIEPWYCKIMGCLLASP